MFVLEMLFGKKCEALPAAAHCYWNLSSYWNYPHINA